MSLTEAVFIALGLAAIGFMLPRIGRRVAIVGGLMAFIGGYALLLRDGAWTFIHNDVSVLTAAAVSGCLAVGALVRSALLFTANLIRGRVKAHG